MSTRAERRKLARNQQKEVNKFRGMSFLDKQASLARNGITQEFLEEKCNEFYRKGLKEGSQDATKMMQETCYEAFILAMHEKFGFGPDRCMKVLTLANQYMIELNDILSAAVALKCKIKIDFSSTFGPEIRKMTKEEYREFRESLE